MTRGIVRQVFRDHYPAYRQTRRMARREEWAARQIQTCRTEAQGSHVLRCETGDYEAERFNSCKHRSCPTCGCAETERWIREQDERVLPGPYHQLVFTMPETLHPLWLYNRVAFTNLLFQSAWESLRSFLDDPRWLGATPGAIGAVQSWGETLNLHVHLHMLITAGGLDAGGRWVKSRASFLCPARALSVKFRGRLRARLLAALAEGQLQVPPDSTPAGWRSRLNKLGRQKWHVQIEPAYEHPRGVIRYLGAYLRRGPIGESRIQRYDRHELSIAYKRPAPGLKQNFTLTGPEFVRRYLVHVPEKGQRLVRHFGLFHHRQRERLGQARRQLAAPGGPTADAAGAPAPTARPAPSLRCPRCGRELVVVVISFRSRAPPERQAA
jgi:hypothetical protein